MICACCGTAKAVLGGDPRLAGLRIPSCWRCRHAIASMCGWTPRADRHGVRDWTRGAAVVTDPERAAIRRAKERRAR